MTDEDVNSDWRRWDNSRWCWPDSPDSGGIRYTKEIPKLYQCVQYKFSDADNWKNAKIIGRAGKSTECTSSG